MYYRQPETRTSDSRWQSFNIVENGFLQDPKESFVVLEVFVLLL
jgi:hypothetical protein